MICVSVFYPAAGESRFDTSYYLEKHCPMIVDKLKPLGLQRLEVDQGLSGFSAAVPPNYLFIARLYFDTLENFQAGMAAVGGEVLGDIPNYTDTTVEMQVSKIQSF